MVLDQLVSSDKIQDCFSRSIHGARLMWFNILILWFSFTLSTQMEMLFCSTVVGLPMLIPPMVLTGELFRAWTSCSQVKFQFHWAVFTGLVDIILLVFVWLLDTFCSPNAASLCLWCAGFWSHGYLRWSSLCLVSHCIVRRCNHSYGKYFSFPQDSFCRFLWRSVVFVYIYMDSLLQPKLSSSQPSWNLD